NTSPHLVQHDVTSIVQEIVNRAGWVSGNAINLYALADTETVTSIDQWDDFSTTSGTPAQLDIDYTEGGGGETYNVSFSVGIEKDMSADCMLVMPGAVTLAMESDMSAAALMVM